MAVREQVEIETLAVRETGPYTGARIAGTSPDVVRAVLTKEYRFADGISIRVMDIPARLDRLTGTTYISGHDGKILMQIVQQYADALRRERTRLVTHRLPSAPIRGRIYAPASLAA